VPRSLPIASAQGQSAKDPGNWPVAALRKLDLLLTPAVAAIPAASRAQSGAEILLPGLCIESAEARKLLSRPPIAPFGSVSKHGILLESLEDIPPFSRLQQAFELSDFDLWLLLVALAPELDLRYERLYGFLQDDISRRRPSVDLALNLLCHSAEQKLVKRAHFEPRAPLIRRRLIRLAPDPNIGQTSLLTQFLKADEGIVAWLLDNEGIDPRFRSFCQLLDPAFNMEDLLLDTATKQALTRHADRINVSGVLSRLYLCGPDGVGKRTAAEALAKRAGGKLLTVNMARCRLPEADLSELPAILCRDAHLHSALLFIGHVDAARADHQCFYSNFIDELRTHAGTVILAGASPWEAAGSENLIAARILFPVPDFSVRWAAWRVALERAGLRQPESQAAELASRFRLTPGQIMRATRQVCGQDARAIDEGSRTLPLLRSDLFEAARAQCGDELGKLTRKLVPKYTWKDIVLPADQLNQLHEISSQAKLRHLVYGEWGFDRKLSLGKGLTILFAGPPGTGKTMAAEVLAKDLELYLYKIDLSQVVSKYIGETEKNLDRIFTVAERSNAILFFDEADALFGKRSEVKDSHDRYANIEIGYLLQKMEEYEGVAILATNLRQNLDEAFVRRIQNIVEFPFPDEEQRCRIWQVTFPPETPVAEDVDFSSLARGVRLAGGNIKNIALAASFYAAEDGRVVRMPHLIRASWREFQKLGKTWNGDQLTADSRSVMGDATRPNANTTGVKTVPS